ncbi:MAG: metal-binding protein [Sulfuritalea sp.]|nr:metal-binding protein [Sulfuritalea sp.]
MRSTLTLVAFLTALSLIAQAQTPVELPPVVIYAPSPCLSCIDWADHLRKGGFKVTMKETLIANMPRLKRWLNVPSDLESIHTATVAGYFLEGFVPIEDVLQLLKEKPTARGLAVPGLVRGTPGREISNPVCETACVILDNGGREKDIRREAYNTLLVESDGSTSIFARH